MRRLFLSVLLSTIFTSVVFATDQATDVLIVGGKTYDLRITPLAYYYEDREPEMQIAPHTSSTGNWRGYVATWEIINDELYLTKINAWFCNRRIRTKSGCRRVTLRDLFGAKVIGGKVAATWFSERLRVHDGKELGTFDFGGRPIYERDITFEVDAGRIIKREVSDNTTPVLPSN